ncbi:hypothetical protein U1Q18_049848, partial [Sarracenia purpurea var. burkii]
NMGSSERRHNSSSNRSSTTLQYGSTHYAEFSLPEQLEVTNYICYEKRRRSIRMSSSHSSSDH